MSVSKRQSCLGFAVLALAVVTPPAFAITFDLDFGSGVHGTLNSVLTGGAQVRTQDRSQDLLGKSNINPGVEQTPNRARACSRISNFRRGPWSPRPAPRATTPTTATGTTTAASSRRRRSRSCRT